jgi:F-type H+-transporting ATPase subunit epsilon
MEMFRLSIVTPEKVFFEADIRSLIVPGTEGYLGVLSNHAPLITALQPGKIEFRDIDDQQHFLAVTSGFLEVSGNVATLLADAVEETEEIDLKRAEAAIEPGRCSKRRRPVTRISISRAPGHHWNAPGTGLKSTGRRISAIESSERQGSESRMKRSEPSRF